MILRANLWLSIGKELHKWCSGWSSADWWPANRTDSIWDHSLEVYLAGGKYPAELFNHHCPVETVFPSHSTLHITWSQITNQHGINQICMLLKKKKRKWLSNYLCSSSSQLINWCAFKEIQICFFYAWDTFTYFWKKHCTSSLCCLLYFLFLSS